MLSDDGRADVSRLPGKAPWCPGTRHSCGPGAQTETCPGSHACLCGSSGVGRALHCPECPGPRGLCVHAHPASHPAGAGAALCSLTAREGERGGHPACVARRGGRRDGHAPAGRQRPSSRVGVASCRLSGWPGRRCHGKPPRSRGVGAMSALGSAETSSHRASSDVTPVLPVRPGGRGDVAGGRTHPGGPLCGAPRERSVPAQPPAARARGGARRPAETGSVSCRLEVVSSPFRCFPVERRCADHLGLLTFSLVFSVSS